jgi:hypothetical protein
LKNCLIMGCGRSGTSMLAGMLHQAGYFMGEKFHQPRDSNPKGFFEWYRINRINEDILAAYDQRGFRKNWIKKLLKKKFVDSPGKNQRWLMALPDGVDVEAIPAGMVGEMRAVLEHEPYAYKDPRFSYTLPAWNIFLKPGTVFLCIFRDPAVTVESILKECRSQEYLADLHISRHSAYRVWIAMHRNIIERLEPRFGNFFYVHYAQIADGAALRPLSDFLQANLTLDFIDPFLKRTRSRSRAPREALDIYRCLCQRAGYIPDDRVS